MFDEFAFGPDALHFRPATDTILGRRRAPLLAVYRDEARAAVGRELMSRPGDRVLAYAGSGHWLHQQQPRRFLADTRDWLAGLVPDPAR